MKKVLKILSWAGLAGWFILIMGFVMDQSEEVLCTHIDVSLDDTLQIRFVTPSDIRQAVESSGMELHGYPLWDIDIHRLECLVEENVFVRNAEVSKDLSGRLEIKVEQRIPQIRIMPEGQRGYYLDEEGRALPLSEHFAPQIMLATGYLPTSPEEAGGSMELTVLHDFCRFLAGDEFWSRQIVQVYANRKGEYELIPRVGAHQILLGELAQWEKKLSNLELLYEQGLSRYGWNTYKTINLKYTNQVICTKR